MGGPAAILHGQRAEGQRVLDGLEKGKCQLPRRGLFVQTATGWVRSGLLGLILRTMPSRALTPPSALWPLDHHKTRPTVAHNVSSWNSQPNLYSLSLAT